MPQMGGIAFLEELRADARLASLPVVVLTSSGEERDKVEAYKLNVAGYVIKPVTFDRCLEVIKTLKDYWNMVELPHAAPVAS